MHKEPFTTSMRMLNKTIRWYNAKPVKKYLIDITDFMIVWSNLCNKKLPVIIENDENFKMLLFNTILETELIHKLINDYSSTISSLITDYEVSDLTEMYHFDYQESERVKNILYHSDIFTDNLEKYLRKAIPEFRQTTLVSLESWDIEETRVLVTLAMYDDLLYDHMFDRYVDELSTYLEGEE